VILKPIPEDIQTIYLESLQTIGIDLRRHDIRFEEDNWEAPTLGAWGIGWQVLLDGLEITQYTYFQQCGGLDLDPPSVELTYGLERIASFLQEVPSVFDLRWSDEMTYGQVRLAEERQFSAYSFESADVEFTRRHFEMYEEEASVLLGRFADAADTERDRFPVLGAYDLCLKCSHLFNVLDSRRAISTTERAAMIGRIRALACRVAESYLTQRGQLAQEQEAEARR
jgi:glycyl-tRNA synthetase alpha chain